MTTQDASADRLRVDYTSCVPESVRLAVVAAVKEECSLVWNDDGMPSLFVSEHYDKVSAAWSIDVTTHDPAIVQPYTDGQVAELLRSIAQERGVSIADMLAAAATLK